MSVNGPITDSGTAANGIINHLVSTQQEGLGNRQANCLRARLASLKLVTGRSPVLSEFPLTSGKVANCRH
jgi:hypothetical protein